MVDGSNDLHRDIVDKGLSWSTARLVSKTHSLAIQEVCLSFYIMLGSLLKPPSLPWNIVSDFSLSSYF